MNKLQLSLLPLLDTQGEQKLIFLLSVMCNVLNHSIFLLKKIKKIQTSCLCSIMQHLPTHYNCGQFTEKTHLIKTVKSEYQSHSSSYWLMIYHNSNSIAHKMTNDLDLEQNFTATE